MSRFKLLPALVLSLGIGFSFAPNAQAEFISTLPSWNGSDSIIYFGEPNTATYGQTITVGATDTFLENFSFRLRTDSGTANFAAYVMEWDSANNRAMGPVLFSSGAMSNNSGPNFNTFDVVANTQLNANTEYVLFFNLSNFFDNQGDSTAFGSTNTNSYSGGRFVFLNNGSDFGALTTDEWYVNWIGEGDLAFTANLTSNQAVPVPGGVVLFGLGLATLGAGRLVRRRVTGA